MKSQIFLLSGKTQCKRAKCNPQVRKRAKAIPQAAKDQKAIQAKWETLKKSLEDWEEVPQFFTKPDAVK